MQLFEDSHFIREAELLELCQSLLRDNEQDVEKSENLKIVLLLAQLSCTSYETPTEAMSKLYFCLDRMIEILSQYPADLKASFLLGQLNFTAGYIYLLTDIEMQSNIIHKVMKYLTSALEAYRDEPENEIDKHLTYYWMGRAYIEGLDQVETKICWSKVKKFVETRNENFAGKHSELSERDKEKFYFLKSKVEENNSHHVWGIL